MPLGRKNTIWPLPAGGSGIAIADPVGVSAAPAGTANAASDAAATEVRTRNFIGDLSC
jgi:hypothetical protein